MHHPIYTEHYTEYFSKNAAVTVNFLDDNYFRSQLINFDKIPVRSNPAAPTIYISNHSGMAFPWDGMVFAAKIYKQFGYNTHHAVRPIAAPMLSQSVLSNPFMVKELWKKVGCVDATFENFEAMMHYPHGHLLVYPEGVDGIAKGFNNKYKLQRFSSSFVYMAIKYQTDIVPVMTISGEYINPFSFKSTFLNKLVNKVGVLFLPITPILLLLVLQPWVFYMAFPAKMRFVRCKTIKPQDLTTELNVDAISRTELKAIAEKIRLQVQVELNAAVQQYGQKNYDMQEFWRVMKQNFRQLPFITCVGWAFLFAEFEHQIKQNKAVDFSKLNFWSIFKIIAHTPLVLCYYIPIVGWLPLLIKGYRGNKL